VHNLIVLFNKAPKLIEGLFMSMLTSSEAVNWQMKLVGIKGQDAKIIQTCVERYTRGDRVSERLAYLVHRLCNAVKCLLGQKSDWQLAEETIEKQIFSYVPSPCRDLIKYKTHTQVHALARRALGLLVWQNEKKLTIPDFAKILVESQIKVAKCAIHQFVSQRFRSYDSIMIGLATASQLYEMGGARLVQAYVKQNITLNKEFYESLFQRAVAYMPRLYPPTTQEAS
jgi:hypothetical protein